MPSRLKIIELQGFKTFASRNEFVFSETITAIVGPNGSGKSNIADAIRWVLGEQSYSLLRAKRTEDMIFSGSEHRSRAGMASVNIVFDNSDGWLPIDFAEVAITRRAYRDGQNEYLINGQRVRLRDIGEMLAQSGLSERTYTVIGQGLVDAALALKAEERRRLFEEAAGVGLHRARREEALRRLDTTRRNLERVQDILAELSPRLRSLERQARRVEEFERVKADLHLLLRDWYGYHWHRSQKDLADAQTAARIQDGILHKARTQQEQRSKELAELAQLIQRHREQTGRWHSQLSELHSQREKLAREMVIIDERVRSLADQGNNIQLELARIEEETGFQLETRKIAESDSIRLLGEVEEAKSQTISASTALHKRQEERNQCEQTIQKIQHALGTLTAQQSRLQARIVERNILIEQQQQQLSDNEAKLVQAQNSLAEISNQCKVFEERLSKSQAELRKLDEEVQAFFQKMTAVDARQRVANDERVRLLAAIARAEAQLDVLENAERSFTGYAEGARILMKAVDDSSLDGIIGIIRSHIEVPETYERAISAVLGEFLDTVLIQGREHLEQVISLLQESNVRSAILPQDSIQAEVNKRLTVHEKLPGFIAFAEDLIQVPDQFIPVISVLLKNVILIESRNEAQRWVDYLRDSGLEYFRIVTLQGEVFYPDGLIMAGLVGQTSTLSRPRERRTLQAQFDKNYGELARLESGIKDLDDEIRALQQAESAVRDEHKKKTDTVRQALEKSRQSNVDLEKNQRNIQFIQENNARVSGELARHRSEVDEMNSELQQIERSLEESRLILRERRELLVGLALDELQAQFTHWQTRQAVAQQSYDDVLRKINELQTVIGRAERSRLALFERLDEFKNQSDELTARKQSIFAEEKLLENEIHEFLEKIKPVETDLEIHELEYIKIQSQEAETRQSLMAAEHQFAQARIVLARRQETMESLRRRIEDDFGLVAFSYDENISGPTPLPLDGFVEQLPITVDIPHDLEENVKRYRAQLRRIGPVNPEIHSEYLQVKDRFGFLTEQVSDLRKAEEDLKEVISELDLMMEREFFKTFEAVASEFRQIFSRLFGGGSARLVLTDPDDLTDTGIDIEARLPGRREQGLSLLSGGERSLTAAALVFSLLKVSPTPFCVLDEVDAMLDETNVGRYRELLGELSEQTQFVVITHNRNTVQAADVIYGVTMGSDSTSQVISLRLDDVAIAVG
jgi:chromosome segregation protein